jgi:glycosyltransferase involved in cell wall biosynthesis
MTRRLAKGQLSACNAPPRVHFLFLNQYFPPDPAPTGVLLAERADELRAHGHTVECIGAAQDYRPGQAKGGRWRREFAALLQILMRGLRAERPDVVLSATSPPCLLVIATLIALRHGAKSAHWVMDLYPEIAVALGEVKSRGLAGLISSAMAWCYRRTDRVIALDADMADRLARHGVRAEVVRPWVFAPTARLVEETTPPARHPMKPLVWIYSGNLGRAHEWETLLEAQRLLEQRDPTATLIFQGGGPARAAAQQRARELALQRCHWRDYAEPEAIVQSLLACDACAVTQLPAARGLLWPSKLGLLLSLPRPIVWVGAPEGAIARDLRGLPHAGVFAPGQGAEIAEWLVGLRERSTEAVGAVDADEERRASLARMRAVLEGLGG